MSDNSLSKLGTEVVAQLGPGPTPQDVMAQRRSFLFAAQPRRSPPRPLALFAVGTAVLAGLVLAIFTFVQLKDLPFWIGPDQTPGVEGQWVEASEAKPLPIHFEGGSEFVLDKGAAARVVHANFKTVILDLSKGRVECRVHGNGKTGWLVRAGTYRVQVTGTAFSVVWDPGDAQLEVTVTHGSVLVFGAALGEHGVKLSAFDHLSVGRDKTTITQDTRPEERLAQQVEAQEPDLRGIDPNPPLTTRPEPSTAGPQNSPARKPKPKEPGWKELYGQKDYDKVIELITAQGLDQFIGDASAPELWEVGNAARYTRRGDVAQRVLKGLINRFPGSQWTPNGTFLLGRVAMELQGNPGAAQTWFEQYLSMAPGGPLAEESLGRLIDVCRLSGKNETAQKYARRYLSNYSGGPFAQLAQSVLESNE